MIIDYSFFNLVLVKAPMKPSLIIFDLDGTLVDSAPDLNACANRILSQISKQPVSLTQSKTFIGDGVRVFIEKTLSFVGYSANLEELNEIERLFLKDYQEHSADLSKPYPGVLETLTKLKTAGFQMGVCSNKPQEASEHLLKTLNLSQFFCKIAGGDYYSVRKPDKHHLLQLIDDLNGTPKTTLMVGDNEHDAAMAKGGNVYFIFCTYGYSRLPIKEIIYNDRISSFSEIIDLNIFK
jgi:phosphoglycolate phosphatase